MVYCSVQILILFLFGVANIFGQERRCGNRFTEDEDTQSIIYSSLVIFGTERCQYTTTLSADDEDLFFITIFVHENYDSGDKLTLPTGQNLAKGAQKWCGIFKKEDEEVGCNTNLEHLCPVQPVVPNQWPPVIRSRSQHYAALVKFNVIRCSENFEEKTTKNTIETTKTTTGAITTRFLEVHTTKSENNSAVTEVTKRLVSTDDNSTPLLAIIIVLGVLLVISLLAMAIFIKKYLTSRNSSSTGRDNLNNSRQTTIPHNNQYENTRINNNYETVSNPYHQAMSTSVSAGNSNYEQVSPANKDREMVASNQVVMNQLNQDTYATATDPEQANELVNNVLYQPIGQ
ncbi:unnamed protein product [Clavelina lepadiformis]|uniref:CUB domain-containing protein n=1 Tax=Clavelina lepadiformis TaxID=159417 RepID=A0ABP0FLG4_CLALP